MIRNAVLFCLGILLVIAAGCSREATDEAQQAAQEAQAAASEAADAAGEVLDRETDEASNEPQKNE
ncbi:MAG: hypothetical protein ACRETT_10060 [Steroidobacteraceae bacterium]